MNSRALQHTEYDHISGNERPTQNLVGRNVFDRHQDPQAGMASQQQSLLQVLDHLSSNPADSSQNTNKCKDQVVQSGSSDQSVRIMSLNSKKAWAYRKSHMYSYKSQGECMLVKLFLSAAI